MKPSGIEWIGDIPDDWEVRKVKRLFSYQKGKNAALLTKEYISLHPGEYPVLSGQTENDGILGYYESYEFDLDKDSIFVTTVGAKAMSTRLVNAKFSLSQNCALLHKIDEKSDVRFLHYALFPMFEWQKTMISLIMQPSLRFEDLDKATLPYPPTKTQQKIADYLDEKCGEIDATIAKQKESIEKLKAYKQSLISETVTKGLDKSAPLKPSGIEWIGDIPAHWEVKKLKFVANFNQNTLPEDTDGQFELKYIDIGNVSSVDGIKEIQYFNFSNAPSRARRIVKYGDIIVSTVRTYLRAITSIKEDYDNCICSTGFAVITPKDNVQQDFVVYAIENESFIAQIIANSQGISYPAINVSQLENLKLAFPSVKEQKEIVDFLKTKLLEIDLTINKKQNIIQKLDAYKKSLIFECVTGKRLV